MGSVYEAVQISLKRKVAIKFLPRHLSFSSRAVDKFQREALAGGRQSHPCIVAVHAVGEYGGIHYIAQELVEGGRTLGDRLVELRDEEKLPIGFFRDVANLVAQVADALQQAHDAKVVHRDIKPTNILLTREGNPKVTDFGLAKVEDALELSRTGEFMGTPYYMSPEQAMSRRIGIDHRTDIYSLGVTLYEMLTLQRPFEGKTSQEVLKKIIFRDPTDPRKVNPRVPRDLAVICFKAMEKDPNRRYQTMAEFGDDLHRFLEGEVILATPSGPAARLIKRIRRNPLMSTSLGVALLAVFALMVSVPWYVLEITKEKLRSMEAMDRANQAKEEADRERTEKERQQKISEGLRLARQSAGLIFKNPGLALLIALESADRHHGLYENNALLEALKCCRELKTLAFGSPLAWADISPDGRWVVMAGEDLTARIGSAATGEETVVLQGHQGAVTYAMFGPNSQRVATASKDGTARIWDRSNGEEIIQMRGHEGPILSVEYSPDSRRVVTASDDGTARIWDAATGNALLILRGHEGAVYRARFNLNGGLVVTASADRTARLWDGTTGEERLVLAGHDGAVYSADISMDDARVVTASGDGTVRIWDRENGNELNRLKAHDRPICCVNFNSDGSRLITASADRTARIFDALSGEELSAFRGHGGALCSAKFNKDDRLVVTGSHDGTARIWSTSRQGEVVTLGGDGYDIHAAGFDGEGQRLITLGEDFTVRIWDVATGAEKTVLKGHDGFASACFSPDGSKVVTGSIDGTVQIWNAESGKGLIKLKGKTGNMATARFGPLGERVLASGGWLPWIPFVSADNTRIWEASTGEQCAFLQMQRGWVIHAAFSPDGRRVVTASEDNTAVIWDAFSGEVLHTLKGHAYELGLRNAYFSPDGSKVVTVSTSSNTLVWDAGTGEKVAKFEQSLLLHPCVHVSPDCLTLILVKTDEPETPVLYDLATGRELLRFRGHDDKIHAAAFSPDGTKVVTASADLTARIWNASTGEELVTLRGHQDVVWNAVFGPRGQRVVTSSRDQTVRIWPVDVLGAAKRCKFREFTFEEKKRFGLWNPGEAEAAKWLETLFDEHLLCADVIARIKGDDTREERVRESALRFARERRDDCNELNRASWEVVRIPDQTPAAYRKALHWAEIACAMRPDEWNLLNTLGVAEYRIGRYEEALSSLERAYRLCPETYEMEVPKGIAFMAMARFRLSRVEEARHELEGIRMQMMNPWWEMDADCQAFLREAEALIVGPHALEARERVTDLLDELLLKEDVEIRLSSDEVIPPLVREEALKILKTFDHDPLLLNNKSWYIVKDPGQDPESYMRALRWAERAVYGAPEWDSGSYLNTLGVAQYRVGMYQDALETLLKADGINGGRPADLAFLAMARFKLGQKAEATVALDQLRALMELASLSLDEDNRAFLREAEALIVESNAR